MQLYKVNFLNLSGLASLITDVSNLKNLLRSRNVAVFPISCFILPETETVNAYSVLSAGREKTAQMTAQNIS